LTRDRPLTVPKKIAFTLVALVLLWAALELLTLAWWWLFPPHRGDGFQFLYQSHPSELARVTKENIGILVEVKYCPGVLGRLN